MKIKEILTESTNFEFHSIQEIEEYFQLFSFRKENAKLLRQNVNFRLKNLINGRHLDTKLLSEINHVFESLNKFNGQVIDFVKTLKKPRNYLLGFFMPFSYEIVSLL